MLFGRLGRLLEVLLLPRLLYLYRDMCTAGDNPEHVEQMHVLIGLVMLHSML